MRSFFFTTTEGFAYLEFEVNCGILIYFLARALGLFIVFVMNLMIVLLWCHWELVSAIHSPSFGGLLCTDIMDID